MSLSLAFMLCASPASPDASAESDAFIAAEDGSDFVEHPTPEAPAPLVVEAVGFDTVDLLDDIRLRVPDRTISSHAEPRPLEAYAYALVTRTNGSIRLTLIRGDGDAYDRTITDTPNQSARVSASALANLLFAVEAGDLAPDRTEVEVPPLPDDIQDAAAVPTIVRTATVEPTPRPSNEQSVERETRHALGVELSAGPTIGLAPATAADPLSGGGGAAALLFRANQGATAFLQLRAIGLARNGHGVARIRVAAGGGYTWRRDRFELASIAAASIEPWLVRHDLASVRVLRDTGSRARFPLLGAFLRASPGVVLRPRSSEGPVVRLGGHVEVAGSFVVDDGARTPELGVQTANGRDAIARMGGVELSVGLDITIWLRL
jgi:hypothetical protein